MGMMARWLLPALLLTGLPVAAAEVKVLSSQAVTTVMQALAPEFERLTGDRLVIEFGVSNAIKSEIDGGAAFDVALLARGQIDKLVSQGAVTAASVTDIAHSGIGIAIRAGAAKPDLGNAASFKRMLLDAQSIAYTSAGSSGVYLVQLIQRFGIGEAMQGKLRPQQSGAAAEQVARGEAQYAFQQISELLPVAGTELAGPLPPDLQIFTTFAAGIGVKAANPAGARALIEFLAAPARAALIEAKGMQPGGS